MLKRISKLEILIENNTSDATGVVCAQYGNIPSGTAHLYKFPSTIIITIIIIINYCYYCITVLIIVVCRIGSASDKILAGTFAISCSVKCFEAWLSNEQKKMIEVAEDCASTTSAASAAVASRERRSLSN